MHLKRTATLAVVGAAVAAWFAAAATSVRRVVPVEPPAVTPAAAAEAELSAQIARLHDRLSPAATPNQPSRDLFRFAEARPARAKNAVAPRAALVETIPAAPVAPTRPAVKLDGIAEDVGPDAVVRTAIISTGGQLFLVREGEAVTTRFRVSRIAADVVELIDLVDNSTLRLPLK